MCLWRCVENINIGDLLKVIWEVKVRCKVSEFTLCAEYQRIKTNKIVPHETFSQPLTTVSTNGEKAFQVAMALSCHTPFVEADQVTRSHMNSHIVWLQSRKLDPLTERVFSPKRYTCQAC